MQERLPSLAAVVSVVILAAVGGWSLYVRQQRKQSLDVQQQREQSLVVNDEFLDIGNVFEQTEFKYVLPIKNVSRDTITGIRIDTSCNCARVTPRHFDLPPNGSVDLEITLNLAPGAENKYRIGATWPFTTSIVAVPAARHEPPQIWKLSGNVHRVLCLESDHVDLGCINDGQTASAAMDFEVDDRVIDIKVELLDPKLVKVELNRSSETPNLGSLRVVAGPMLPIGPIRTRVRLICTLNSGLNRPAFIQSVAIRGERVSDIDFAPCAFSLGVIGPDARDEILLVRSKSALPIEFVEWESSTPDVAVTATAAQEDSSRLRIVVRVSPSRIGAFSEEVMLSVRHADDALIRRIVIPIQYERMNRMISSQGSTSQTATGKTWPKRRT